MGISVIFRINKILSKAVKLHSQKRNINYFEINKIVWKSVKVITLPKLLY